MRRVLNRLGLFPRSQPHNDDFSADARLLRGAEKIISCGTRYKRITRDPESSGVLNLINNRYYY